MVDLSIDIGSVRLKNPVIPASGTFSDAYGRVFDLTELGALVPKTVTPEPRAGHPAPRIAETAGGLINAIGIPSRGIDAFLTHDLPRYRALGPPVVVSISADTVEDFATLAARLDGKGHAALELNLSCPNLEEGGRAFALDEDATAAVTAACRAVTVAPLWVKLSPNAGSPVAVARAAERSGAAALIVANTQLALALSHSRRPRLANRTGGLSGAPLKPVNLRLTDEIACAVSLPVIGCGGIASLADALDYLAVGASAVAVGTATFARATAMPDLIAALRAHCDFHGVSVRDCIGIAREAA